MQQVLVIGLGHFGSALVEEFINKGCEVIVIESDKEKGEKVKDIVSQVVIADATNKDLLAQFAKDMDYVIVCLSDRIDSSVLITYYLKELGVMRIIAKASSPEHGEILKVVGAHDVIYPERDTAQRLVTSLTSPNVLEFVKLAEGFEIVEIAVPEDFVKNSIRDLQLRNKYGIEILAVKNPLTGEVKVMPSPDYTFRPDDVIIAIGDIQSIQKIGK
ncbi:MAG: potassium transporter TrkA [Candidatus Omnitrophica bacterium CG12_big_fil_rev_8_21_14_0_65_50_5]|nr:MAG: potassium transporter TrkA [Candidatus Omnitrophica bacterium CG12_big_fil_rev_8_21_14_0_65_50_5]